jgi:hypothetical protein
LQSQTKRAAKAALFHFCSVSIVRIDIAATDAVRLAASEEFDRAAVVHLMQHVLTQQRLVRVNLIPAAVFRVIHRAIRTVDSAACVVHAAQLREADACRDGPDLREGEGTELLAEEFESQPRFTLVFGAQQHDEFLATEAV